MPDIYPPSAQRQPLLDLVEALGCRDACLRRDEYGDWCLYGKLGHIYAIPGTLRRHNVPGFLIYWRGAPEFAEATPMAWTWAKKMLIFCEVTLDGDAEGMLFLDRLPTVAEAEIIRDKLGIPKKRELGEQELERLRQYAFQSRDKGGE